MQQNITKCTRYVGDEICPYCSNICINHGKTSIGKIRYYCKSCKRTHIHTYTYKAYLITTNRWITNLTKEGCGIRSVARLLQISITTVIKRILSIARSISKPLTVLNKTYEIDELRTFYKSKTRLLWIVYALRRDTKEVADFAVGRRTIATLRKVIDTVILSGAKKIYTDKLHLYNYIIPANIHSSKCYNINHIERKNLSLRTHLKRLSRKSICFSKSAVMLIACLKIYF